MNPARITMAALLATAAVTTIAPTVVGAAADVCRIEATPWDGRSYALTVVADGVVTPLITRQSGLLDGQTSWDITGLSQVWWAAKDPARQAVADDFYDVYDVAGCSLVGGYRGVPGRQDSITLTAVQTTTTTTTTAPEPTTTTTGPAPITTWSTTPSPSVVDEPLTPAPATTVATADTLRSPYAATTPTLPATGPGLAGRLGLAGLLTVALGAVAVAIGRRLDGGR